MDTSIEALRGRLAALPTSGRGRRYTAELRNRSAASFQVLLDRFSGSGNRCVDRGFTGRNTSATLVG